MRQTPEAYFNRPIVNREAARQALGVDGTKLNELLQLFGYVRDPALGLKRYRKTVQTSDKVLTSYLVGSEVHPEFWGTLLYYCETTQAELVVLPLRYRNPTVLQEALQQDSETYIAPEVRPYLCSDRFDFGFTRVLADVKINPTNLQPLNTLLPFSYGRHLVVGHSTQQILPLTTGRADPTLTAWSTGSCSIAELSDSLAGKKAELHHRLGFVRLATNSIRSVHATKAGSFCDDGAQYRGSEVSKAVPDFCVLGDIHFGSHDPIALDWALDSAEALGVKNLYLNDSFDGSTVNHHVRELFNRTQIFDFVTEEVVYHRDQMGSMVARGFVPKLVHSNHTDFLTRWAENTDRGFVHRKDLDLFDALQNPNLDLDPILGAKTLPTDFIHNSFRIVHGHERFNGARGGIRSYTSTGTRTIFGHTHQVASLLGHENIGCLCKLEQDYNKGFSSWQQAFGVCYPDKKFQHHIKW